MLKASSLGLLALFALLALSSQASYDPAIAADMAKACFASYCTGASLQNMKCGENCDGLKGYQYLRHGIFNTINSETVSYTTFVNPVSKRFVVAFRGTVGNTQLVTELFNSKGVKLELCNVKNAYVGYYFYDAYKNSIRSDFLAHLKAMAQKYPDYEYYISGHSLGGALASLAAMDLSCAGILHKDHIHLYTYGSPRLGDANMAKAVLDNVHDAWRITHNKDIVPHVPVCTPNSAGVCTPFTYDIAEYNLPVLANGWHLGQEVFYSQDFKTHKICQGAEDPTCSNQFKLFNLMFLQDSFKDHLTYFGAVNNCK